MKLILRVLIRYRTWEITCEWQNIEKSQLRVKHYVKRYKQQK